jgi:hypothetical protein
MAPGALMRARLMRLLMANATPARPRRVPSPQSVERATTARIDTIAHPRAAATDDNPGYDAEWIRFAGFR